MAFQIFHFLVSKIENCRLPHFWAPVVLCDKGYPKFCDMESKDVPKYSSFMTFRVWVFVVVMCHTDPKMDKAAFWNYIDSSISWNWFGDIELFLLHQQEGSNGFQMSKKNKRICHSVWYNNYLEINFLYNLCNQGLCLGHKLENVCQCLYYPIYVSNVWGFGGPFRKFAIYFGILIC